MRHGSDTVSVNQETSSGAWNLLGTYDFNAGNATVSLTDQANGYVIADAVMLLPPGTTPNTATWTPNVAQAGQYEVYARWTQHANRATNATYTVTHATGSSAIPVNQQQGGGAWNLLGTFSLSPGSTHKVSLTDQADGFVIADAIRLVPVAVQAEKKLYFIHVDHLNSPRLITNSTGQAVWRLDHAEPFGDTHPDENPSGLGVFEFPLRHGGWQYADKETGEFWNWMRVYSAALGRFDQFDPIGLRGGINGYAYLESGPLDGVDPHGLANAGPARRNQTQVCDYYTQACSRCNNFYYCYLAPTVCRSPGVVPTLWPADTTKVNCVRNCLVEEDKKEQNNQKSCTPNCLPPQVIDDYHCKCYRRCGLSGGQYPGFGGAFPCT